MRKFVQTNKHILDGFLDNFRLKIDQYICGKIQILSCHTISRRPEIISFKYFTNWVISGYDTSFFTSTWQYCANSAAHFPTSSSTSSSLFSISEGAFSSTSAILKLKGRIMSRIHLDQRKPERGKRWKTFLLAVVASEGGKFQSA